MVSWKKWWVHFSALWSFRGPRSPVVPSAALAVARTRPPSEFRTQPQGFQPWNPAEAPPPYLRQERCSWTSPGSALISRCNLRATGSLPTPLCAARFFGGDRCRPQGKSASPTTVDHLRFRVSTQSGTTGRRGIFLLCPALRGYASFRIAGFLVLSLLGCASRVFDNPVDPENPLEGIRVLSFYDAPGSQTAGLAFEEEELWVVDSSESRLYRIFARDGRSDFQRRLDLGTIFGVAPDDNFLWMTQPGQGSVARINPFTGELLQQPLPTQGGDPRGVAFDGELLWVIDGADSTLARIDPILGVVGEPIPVPTINSPGGLAFRGAELWAIDQLDSRLVQLGADGSEIRAISLPGTPAVGLASDGKDFYYSDRAGRVYLIELVEDPAP